MPKSAESALKIVITMMGKKRTGQGALFAYNASLGSRVPKDHPLRQIDRLIDFDFVRKQVRDSYGSNGHESEDPIVIVKLMLLLFLEGVKSERELMRTLEYRIDWLWFLGFTLQDRVPDHSVLSKARRRWGEEVFAKLFKRVVRQCMEAGLLSGDKIHVDGSLVDANTCSDQVVINRICREQQSKLTERTPRVVSATDRDAVVIRHSKKGSRPRYKHHRAIDDKQGVITAVRTTRAHIAEPDELMGLIDDHEEVTGEGAQTVVADSQYGTHEQYRQCQKRGLRTHMGDLSATQPKRALYGLEDFRYEPQRDVFVCPAGQELGKKSWIKDRRYRVYAIKLACCRNCELRSQCTNNKKRGRRLLVPLDYELIQQARAQAASAEAIRDRRRRTYLMEGSFADATNNHHFKRSRWRGLHRQRVQDLLIATCQNLRKLMAHSAPLHDSLSRGIAWLKACQPSPTPIYRPAVP